MFRTRLLLLAVAIVVGMAPLIASPGTAGAAQNPNKPVELSVDETFLAPNLTSRCGFDVWAHVYGTFTIKAHPGGADLLRFRYTHTFSGPGGSVSVKRVENARATLTVSPDGTEVESITATGTLMYHMVLPGHGSIGNNSGREVFQVTWAQDASGNWYEVDYQVFFDSGPNNELSDAEFALICEYLA